MLKLLPLRRVTALVLVTVCGLFLAGCEQWQIDAVVAAHRVTNVRGGPSDAVLARLRACESGGNYRAVSSSGTYRGAYQFSRSTWNSVARSVAPAYVGVDPAAAPAHVQDAMARALWARSGPSQWPVCGRRAG